MKNKKELSEKAKEMIRVISEKIISLRKEKNISQEELAKNLGCSLNYLKRMERGDVHFRLATLVALCESLELPRLTDLGITR